jgi:hypothetical protein
MRNAECELELCGRGKRAETSSGVAATLPDRLGKIIPSGYSWADNVVLITLILRMNDS